MPTLYTVFVPWRLLALAPLLTALLSLVACDDDAPQPLCVGINPWPGYEILYLAAVKGYYRDAGVDVRVVEFASPADERRAYERGQLDVMAATAVEVLQARERGRRAPQIVQVIDYSNGADVILVRPNTPGISALRGARVGVELSSLGSYVLARGLEIHGLRWPDVTTVSLDQASLEDSFRKGELDAIVSYPPTSVRLLRDGYAKVAFSTSEIPAEVLDVIAVDAPATRRSAQDIARLLQAYHRALTDIRENPDAAYAIMASREGLTVDEFRAAIQGGVTLVSADDQPEYFQTTGRLEVALERYASSLGAAKQLAGVQQPRAAINTEFVIRGASR